MIAERPAARPAPKRRPPKRTLRRWAWGGGVATFVLPLAALGAVPKPPAAAEPQPAEVIEIHKVIRRIIIHDPPNAPLPASAPSVRVVYVGGRGGGSAGGGGGGAPVHTRCSTC
jgi:hypothetical protein